MKLAPVVLFVYNRPKHTQKILTALSQNFLAKKSRLYIFSDGPKNDVDNRSIKQVRNLLRTITGFKEVTITQLKKNLGLANSVIKGVSSVLQQFQSTIVLEDDLITHPNFLEFMNQSLLKYKKKTRVGAISGYGYPPNFLSIPKNYLYQTYFLPRGSSWGWASWKDRWQNVDWSVSDYDLFIKDKLAQLEFSKGGADLPHMLAQQMAGRIDSWAIRWNYHLFKQQQISLYPIGSLISNIGFDGSGTHTKKGGRYSSPLVGNYENKQMYPSKTELNTQITKTFSQQFRYSIASRLVSSFTKLLNRIKT